MARLRIATFNLENLGAGVPAPSIEARIAALRPQLLRLEADLLCLQEVNAQEIPAHHGRSLAALDQLLQETPYASFARAVSTGPHGTGPADRHNLVLLSRWPLATQRQVWHDLVPPLDYRPVTAAEEASAPVEVRFDRPILYAAVSLPSGQRLHLLNLHLKAPVAASIPGQKLSARVWQSTSGWAEGFFLASLKRARQSLEARLLLDDLFGAEPEALVAVCGDFNADSREVPVRMILGSREDTGNPSLASRAMAALEQSVASGQRYSVLHAGRPVMLDHILVSRHLLDWHHHAEVHNEGLGDEVFDAAATPLAPISYHAPVVAEFTVPD